ncbi:MAG TPA: T9SS type A sorting domain-containing protein, partial [Phaeodactylibacter sp.]|nr:T9SS type A sorting domain-containing protein [Phaeodactylibacter sp.]
VDENLLPDPNEPMPSCFSLLLPPSISAAGNWFRTQSPIEETTFSCFRINGPAVCLLSADEEPGPIREVPNGFGFKLATGQFHAAQFEAAQAWAGKRHLYERLLEHQDTTEQWKRTFLDSMEQHSIGQLAALDLLIGEALQLSEQEQEGLEQAFQQQNEWLQEWQSMEALDGHTDSLLLKEQQAQLLDSLSVAAQSSSQLLQSVQQSRSSSLSQAALLNSLVTTDSTYDTNERFVNELYLSTIAQGYLPDDELDIEQLWSIATQCPLEGGDAVFRARSIYRLFDPLIYFPDDSLCQSDSLELRQSLKPEKELPEPELAYRLFPNPSTGQAPQISFSKVLSQPAIVQVFRANGRMVSDLSIQSGVQHTTITNTTLQPGVYVCIITLSDGERLPVERFVVIE